jgi:hypothetical protein
MTGRAWGASARLEKDMARPLHPTHPRCPPKAKRVIYLHMAGSPSQLELFDYKPELARQDGKDCPASLLAGKQFAFIQGVPKMLGPQFPFQQHGQSGQWVSDRLPHFASVVDDVCFIKSMYTDQFNHGPAQLLMHTGTQNPGGPAPAPGRPTVSAPRTKTSPASSCSPAAARTPTPANPSGAPASCPPSTRACNAGRRAIPFSSSRTRPASPADCAAARSMP